jgi:hypothetical protein
MRELKGDWRDLFNGFMMALDLRKMFLGFVGLLLTFGAEMLFLKLCDSYDPMILRNPAYLQADPKTPLLESIVLPRAIPRQEPAELSCRGVCLAMSASARHLLNSPDWRTRVLIPFGVFLIAVLIWSYFGGAIARIAAVEVARDERIETQKGLQFATQKYTAFFWAPLICILFFLFFGACNFVGGAAGRVVDSIGLGAFGGVLVAIFLPLAILSGFLMALILIGTLLGAPLFAPAVGAEGTDSFDAISRGFSYVYSRPWHYGWYQLVSAVYGTICVGFVWWFGCLMIQLGLGAGRAGVGLIGKPENFDCLLPVSITRFFFGSDGGYSNFAWPQTSAGKVHVINDTFWNLEAIQIVAAVILLFWLFIVFGMLMGYVVSYVFSSQTLIYFLLRKKVDGIEMNEVYEEKEEDEGAIKPAETAGTAGESAPSTSPPPSADSTRSDGTGPAASPPPADSGGAPPAGTGA